VLVNGSPTKEFKPRKWLRQGDPLAPFLFLIVAEGLAGAVREAVDKDMLKSVEIGGRFIKVNMLRYADDTLFFCKAQAQSVLVIKAILNCFELASGLKVNFQKSSVGGVGCSPLLVEQFTTILNCEKMKIPFIYLGLSVGGCHKRSKLWEEVVEKLKRRLSKWKGKFILMAGRLCLIKSVLSALPLFFLSLFKMSAMVMKDIERLQRNFLWGWDSEGRKISWVSWKKVYESKEDGGLGVISLRRFNFALLGKWIWRLGSENTGLWKEVLDSKYGG